MISASTVQLYRDVVQVVVSCSSEKLVKVRSVSTPNADQNLLFGFMALQMGLISREELIAATSIWLPNKSQPLDRVLMDRGWLAEDNHHNAGVPHESAQIGTIAVECCH
jgi:hypothetical protein